MTLTEMIFDYHKKHGLAYKSKVYMYTYPDGSTEVFTIETAEKERELWDPIERTHYTANVFTKQYCVTTKGSMGVFDWFYGERRFNTVKAAIRAIDKSIQESNAIHEQLTR